MWYDEAIPALRVMINDTDPNNEEYSDVRLLSLLIVAARYVNQEISFDRTYTITISTCSISPDPTTDDVFINFIILKAACLADQSLFRTKAAIAGLEARCGPAMLKTLNHLPGFVELLDKGPCAAYEKLKKDYIFGNAIGIRAIISPFASNDFNPQDLT